MEYHGIQVYMYLPKSVNSNQKTGKSTGRPTKMVPISYPSELCTQTADRTILRDGRYINQMFSIVCAKIWNCFKGSPPLSDWGGGGASSPPGFS